MVSYLYLPALILNCKRVNRIYLQPTRRLVALQDILRAVLVNPDLGIVDGNMQTDIDGIIYPGDDFVKFQKQAISSGQISPTQLHNVMQNVYHCYRLSYKVLFS